MDILRFNNKPYFYVDVPIGPKNYLLYDIEKDEEHVEELEMEYKLMNAVPKLKDSVKAQNLRSWIDYLKIEISEKEDNYNTQIRPLWIVKQVLDILKFYKGTDLYIMHFSPKQILPKVRTVLEENNITVVPFNLKREFLAPTQTTR